MVQHVFFWKSYIIYKISSPSNRSESLCPQRPTVKNCLIRSHSNLTQSEGLYMVEWTSRLWCMNIKKCCAARKFTHGCYPQLCRECHRCSTLARSLAQKHTIPPVCDLWASELFFGDGAREIVISSGESLLERGVYIYSGEIISIMIWVVVGCTDGYRGRLIELENITCQKPVTCHVQVIKNLNKELWMLTKLYSRSRVERARERDRYGDRDRDRERELYW